MTEHLITPPHVLVEQLESAVDRHEISFSQAGTHFYTAGADQELEACLDQLRRWGIEGVENLRNTRRPKPPSLKEQALEQLECVNGILRNQGIIKTDIIRRALEALPDD